MDTSFNAFIPKTRVLTSKFRDCSYFAKISLMLLSLEGLLANSYNDFISARLIFNPCAPIGGKTWAASAIKAVLFAVNCLLNFLFTIERKNK